MTFRELHFARNGTPAPQKSSQMAINLTCNRGFASTSDVPRLIKDDARSGVLVGPWPDSWTLTKKEWIDVVEVFVNGWESGRRKWTRLQIEAASGVTFRTMAELFRGAPEWQTYFRGADGNDKPRLGELNIGTPDHSDASDGTGATAAEPEIS